MTPLGRALGYLIVSIGILAALGLAGWIEGMQP